MPLAKVNAVKKTTAPKDKTTGKAPPIGHLAQMLDKLGLRNDWDFILHLPLRYEDETRITKVSDCREGVAAQIEAEIIHNEIVFKPRRQLVVQAKDGDELIYLRFLNFYGSQQKQLAPGRRVRCFGEVRQGFFGAEMVHPRVKIIVEGAVVDDSLTPVYPSTAGFAQSALRKLITRSLGRISIDDVLPVAMRERLRLSEFAKSVRYLHQPPPDASQQALSERTHPAWRRIKFDELLAQQIAMRRARRAVQALHAPALTQSVAEDALTMRFLKVLPFTLTNAQARVWAEISGDMSRTQPMQRLLQGDVGCGKTMVAALAATQAIQNGYQAAFMAPTEILAEQHYRKLSTLFSQLGVKVAWLTGSLKAKEKREAVALIATGEAQLAIGTHALFQTAVQFANLGLAIIDEQHRFGVNQRLALRSKAAPDSEAHQLMMSATPIPRTLSMSYFADLDVSIIDELPPGRTPITTRLVPNVRRDELLDRVEVAVSKGAQAYWVCPLIEESETLQLATAVETQETLQLSLPNLKVGLVHGRMKSEEKNAVMTAFLANEINLLVATTVIEIGVDVPNASLMVIEHSERMGLAQLHQLRGRVGRGSAQSSCVLLYEAPLGQVARERLKIISETTDGFEIARQDLRIRGPGEYLGARQSGAPMLRFADVEADAVLLELARDACVELEKNAPDIAEAHLQRWLGSRENYLKA